MICIIRRYKTMFLLSLSLSIAYTEESIEHHYQLLKKGESYANLSFIEIAAHLDDFRALNHFIPYASINDLIEARAILENKADLLKQEINYTPPRDTSTMIEKEEHKQETYHTINHIKSIISRISDKINALKK